MKGHDMRKVIFLIAILSMFMLVTSVLSQTTFRKSKYKIVFYDPDNEDATTTWADFDSSCIRFNISSNEWEIIVYDDAGSNVFKLNTDGGMTSTGVSDFGGASSVEIPNGTSGTTNATGEVYFDSDGDGATITDGIIQIYNGSANMYYFGSDGYPASDDQILKYNAGTNTFDWEADAGGAEIQIQLDAQSAKLPSSNMAVIDGGENTFKLLFDASTDESCWWTGILDDDYDSSTLYADVFFSMATATSDTVVWGVQIMAYTPGDAADIDTDSYATVNLDTVVVPGTAGYMKKTTVTLTNDDGIAGGDYYRAKLYRDADNTSDAATGDAEVYHVIIRQ